MVQIPTRENLGQARVNGRATPAQINPNVAYDIGRAGAAMDRAMSEVAAAFAGIGAKQQAMDDATWLAEAKIRTLEADDAIRRDTELNAGEDGTGFEQAPTRFKGAVDEVKKRPGGSQEARAKYELWSAEQGYETGRWAANTAQKRLHESTLGKLDKRLDTLSALSSANPERAEEYLSAYEEEINGYVGSAITASDAKDRIDNARSTIGKASIVSRALKNPADFGKALKAVEGAGRPDIVDTETRGLGRSGYEPPPTPTGLVEPGNIDLDKRKVLRQGNVIKTEESMSIGTDRGEVLIPTVVDGKKLSEKEAIAHFEKTGQHLGIFKTPEDADKYAQALHERQGRFYGAKASEAKSPASVSFKLETGSDDPLKGVKNISHDSRGTKSYGNFGINSGGSAQQFQAQYGEQFGLTARPGTKEFDAQWRNAAGAAPVELHAAEMEWWDATIGSKLTNTLIKVGVSSDVANDPRVKAYFADRMVQYGPESTANHANRVKAAFEAARGDPEKFLREMSRQDKSRLSGDFRSALAGETASPRGLVRRVNGRLERSLAVTGGGPTSEVAPSVDLSKMPKVDGTIQPVEILKLSPEDRARVVKELAPSLQVEMQNRMNQALASVASKGTQNIITLEEIDDSAPIIGAKNAAKWKEQLTEAKVIHDSATLASSMSRRERYNHLAELAPTGNPDDLADQERLRYNVWAESIKVIEKGIKDDPLKFLSQNNESGRQATKLIAGADAGKDGTPARERAYDTLIELQRREGVAPGDIRILHEDEAVNIVKRLQDAKTGPAALVQLEGLRQTYGKHFDQIWGELVANGAPSTYLALRTATRDGQDALVQTYALEKAMSEGKETKKDILRERVGVKAGELNQAVSTKIADFINALDHKESSNKLMEAYRNAVERTTLYYISTGKSLDDAVNTAADEIYSKRLSTYRGAIIPRDVEERIGPSIKETMNYGMSDLIDGMLSSPENKILNNVRPSPGLTPGQENRRMVDNIKAYPKFVTNEDASGVYILDEKGDYVILSTPEGTKPMMFTWEQLSNAYKNQPLYKRKRIN